ncbi:MAG: (d)CMP kinase [Granulosicoccus sp.]
MVEPIPVITIDGPSGAGKGTVAQNLADQLGFHLLDSGAVYRAAALHALNCQAKIDDEPSVMAALESMKASFQPHPDGVKVDLNGRDVTQKLRLETTASAASKVAVMPAVRASLLDEQRSFRTSPGLVADGRDMGTVVFPDATLKVFLSASVEVRALRRAKQLKDKGIETTMPTLLQEIGARDERDSSREHSPLVAAHDALIIDSSDLSIRAVVARIVAALPILTAVE